MDRSDRILQAFGARVRQARLAKGLTQVQLADLSGLSPTFIVEVERGQRFPSLRNAGRIYEALGYSAENLLLPKAPDTGRQRARRRRG